MNRGDGQRKGRGLTNQQIDGMILEETEGWERKGLQGNARESIYEPSLKLSIVKGG